MKQIRILRIARLEALTDGVFAIALTILVLNIPLPNNLQNTDLTFFLKNVVIGKLFIYIGSFIILGTQWIGIHVQHGYLERVNRPYLWANIFYLMTICITPFSANFLASYSHAPISIIFYASNLIFANLGWLLTWQCAYFFQLNISPCTADVHKAVFRRINLTFLFYIAAVILAYWNTHLAFLVLIAPPLMHMIVFEKSLRNI